MFNKTLINRKAFTLLELIIAIGLIGLVVGSSLKLLVNQVKTKANLERKVETFFYKQIFLEKFRGLFFHLASYEKRCLICEGKEISIIYDAGKHLDPKKSGVVCGRIFLEDQFLTLEQVLKDQNTKQKLLNEPVIHFEVKFFSQETMWQEKWNSSTQGLPEMMHLILKTKTLNIDTKYLLPYALKPVKPLCKSSLLSFQSS